MPTWSWKAGLWTLWTPRPRSGSTSSSTSCDSSQRTAWWICTYVFTNVCTVLVLFCMCKMPCESAVDLRASVLCCQRTKLNEQKVDEYCRILAEIAAEQKFEVTYVDLPDPSLTGEFYLWFRRQHCLVCQSFYLCRFSPNVLRMSRFAGFLPGQHQCMVELRHKKDKSRKPIVCLGMGDSQQRAHEIGAQNALSTLDGIKERNTWMWSVRPCRCHYVTCLELVQDCGFF